MTIFINNARLYQLMYDHFYQLLPHSYAKPFGLATQWARRRGEVRLTII
jgi:hypothetical protein